MNINDLTQEQLDALIAEKVMGWTLVPGVPGESDDTYDEHTNAPYDGREPNCWSPSTSIADAWEVVGVFDTWDFKRWYDPETAHLRGGDPFFVSGSVTRFDPEEFGESGKQPTLQRAICIAALAATGVEL